MKTMKKILALVLALTLCLGLSVTALAESNESQPTTGYTITIKNAIAGQKYTAYKIFDAIDGTPDGAAEKKVSYTIDSTSEWFNVVAGYKANPAEGETSAPIESVPDGIKAIDTGYVVLTQINGTTKWSVTASKDVTSESTSAAAAFAEYLAKNTEGKTGVQVTAEPQEGAGEGSNAGTATINVTGEGYYFVNTSLGALTSLNTLTGNTVEIKEKNTEPTVDKEVQEDSKVNSENEWGDKNTADIGQVVNFKSTITVAKGAAKSIVLHDTMSPGLMFINVTDGNDEAKANNLKVTVNGTVVNSGEDTWQLICPATDADEINSTPACTFDVKFADAFIEKILKDNLSENVSSVEIIVEYSATVTAEAVIGGEGNKNETHLSYGDESKVTSTTDTTTTYVYEFNIFKYTDVNELEVALRGAEFVLSKVEGEKTLYAQVVEGKLVGWSEAKDSENVTLTSNADGYISIKGLDAGTYSLEETKAPDGYNMLEKPITVVISEPDADNAAGGVVTQDGVATSTMGQNESAVVNVVKVENKSGTELPSTGGIGTTIFYVVGGILMLGAVILLITKKKMGSKQ